MSTLDSKRTSRLLRRPPRDLAAAADLAVSGSLNVAEFKVDLALSTRAAPGGFGHPEAVWMHLDEVVLTGRPAMASWRSQLGTNPERARAFLEALDVLARISGPPVHELTVLAPGKRVLDVGGGLGTYSRQLDEAGSIVTLVDLPEVAAWAGERLERTGVSVIGIDLFEHGSCGVSAGSMDSALVSHLLHDLPEGRAIDLLHRVEAALIPGGHIVVNDVACDVGPGAFGSLFDVMMRVETTGAAHSQSTLESMLGESGFVDITRIDLDDPLTVLVGRKA